MKNSEQREVRLFGGTRELAYMFSRLIPAVIAIVIAKIGYKFFVDFWPSLFVCSTAEDNAIIADAMMEYDAYLGIINQIRVYLCGFEVAIILCLFGIVPRLFYLKKKTNAYTTLARLPMGRKYKAQIYKGPVIWAIVLYIIRFVYIFAYINILTRFEGTEILVKVLFENIWRLLL